MAEAISIQLIPFNILGRLMKKYFIIAMAIIAAACSKISSSEQKETKIQLCFSAEASVSKTSLGADWSVSWVEDDPVSILWNGGRADTRAKLKDGKAFFSAVVDEKEEYYAIYPSSIPATVTPDGEIDFTIPSSQSGRFEDCAVITAKTSRKSLDFGRFKSAVALVSFTITGEDYGSVVFTAPEVEAVTIATPSAGKYYFALPAGVSLSSLKFTLGSKGTAEGKNPVTLQAGDILCIDKPLEENMEVIGDVHISDVSALIALLKDPVKLGSLDGHTIHIDEGTYDLGSSEEAIELKLDSPVSLRLAGVAGKTIFTTSLDGDKGCILTASKNVSLTLEGIRFTGASHNGTGGALCLTAGDHLIRNCEFIENECTSSSSDRTGAGIYVGGTASADIRGCLFEGNKVAVTGGGAIGIYTEKVCSIEDCTFNGNNLGKIGNGGAILQKKAGNYLYVVGCHFKGNACKTNGSDIFSSAGAGLLLYGCDFADPIGDSAGNLGCVRSNVPLFAGSCTMTAAKVGEANGLLAIGKSSDTENVIVDNIILCNEGNAISSAFTSSNTSLKRTVVSFGHNLYTKAPNIEFKGDGVSLDKSGTTLSEYTANGAPEGYTRASDAEKEAALNAAVGGNAFLFWLKTNNLF